MQDAGYELRRILLLRRWVNKDRKRKGRPLTVKSPAQRIVSASVRQGVQANGWEVVTLT
jgi:hypothetical protein